MKISKKIIGVLLIVSLVCGAMGLTASALWTPTDYKTFAASYTLGDAVNDNGSQFLDVGTIYTQDNPEVVIPIRTTLFTGQLGESSIDRNLTSEEIRQSGITVGTSFRAGSNVIKDVYLDRYTGEIVVEFVDEFVSVKDQNFELHVFLNINGTRYDSQGLTIIGKLQNKEISVWGNHDFADISGGYVLDVTEFNKNLSVYIGNGVTIHTPVFKDKSYYGVAIRNSDYSKTEVVSGYPEVSNVLTLKTIGFNRMAQYVTLSTDYKNYYVYGKDMEYLGRGTDKLSFSEVYYLCDTQLNVGIGESATLEEKPTLSQQTDETITQTAPNRNHNPSTGR